MQSRNKNQIRVSSFLIYLFLIGIFQNEEFGQSDVYWKNATLGPWHNCWVDRKHFFGPSCLYIRPIVAEHKLFVFIERRAFLLQKKRAQFPAPWTWYLPRFVDSLAILKRLHSVLAMGYEYFLKTTWHTSERMNRKFLDFRIQNAGIVSSFRIYIVQAMLHPQPELLLWD